MTLGRYPRVTLARARTMALDALARVHVGEDPRRTAAANVADLAAAYLAEYVRPNLRSCRDVERRFKKDVLPAIGTVPLADLHKRDINRVISPIVQRGRQEQAGRVFLKTYAPCFAGASSAAIWTPIQQTACVNRHRGRRVSAS
jgi:hypothetical protein